MKTSLKPVDFLLVALVAAGTYKIIAEVADINGAVEDFFKL